MNNSVLVKPSESREWLTRSEPAYQALLKAYRETMPYSPPDLFSDSNFRRNSHIINSDFSINPKYVAGYSTDFKNGILILSCLYIFPKYRKHGIATELLNTLKQNIPFEKGVIIQLCISREQHSSLHDFYTSRGFVTTGIPNSESLIDYFWWHKELKLSMTPGNTHVLVERIY